MSRESRAACGSNSCSLNDPKLPTLGTQEGWTQVSLGWPFAYSQKPKKSATCNMYQIYESKRFQKQIGANRCCHAKWQRLQSLKLSSFGNSLDDGWWYFPQVLSLTILQCYKYTEDGFCFNQTTQGKREQGENGVSGVFSIKLPASFELECRKLLSNSNSCRWVFSSLLWGAQVSNERTCKVLGIHNRLEHLATGTILTFLNFLDLSCEANFGIWPFQLRLAELIKRPNPELSFKASLFPQPPPAKIPFKHIYYLKIGFVKYKYGIR